MEDEAQKFSEADILFMRRALSEARKGLGRTSPNPCVGAVIVKDGEIIATGYHKKAGGPHAEIVALQKAGGRASGATMYVTLEPCNHTGRTPPCSRAVAESGIRQVCIGMLDPNPLVDGGGAQLLGRVGIEVNHGLLEDRCRELNKPFITYITKGRPWVVLKAGMTLDGRIAFKKDQADSITGPESIRSVHRLRDRCDAILVGRNTVDIDDPSLTTRIVGRKGKDPIRVILDTNLNISAKAKIVTQSMTDGLTRVMCGQAAPEPKIKSLEDQGVSVTQIPVDDNGRLSLSAVLKFLGSQQITSLLVEGGAAVHGSFLKAGLADHLEFYYSPLIGGDGGTGVIENFRVEGGRERSVKVTNVRQRRLGKDFLLSGDLVYPDKKS